MLATLNSWEPPRLSPGVGQPDLFCSRVALTAVWRRYGGDQGQRPEKQLGGNRSDLSRSLFWVRFLTDVEMWRQKCDDFRNVFCIGVRWLQVIEQISFVWLAVYLLPWL